MNLSEEFAEVEVFEIRQDRRNQVSVVLLKDTDHDLFLPIWIGELEAVSIEFALTGKNPPRPMTHDLLANVTNELGAEMQHVQIDRLVDQTYYATVILETDGETVEIDSRPSDGINLALRMDRPILADRSLLQELQGSGAATEEEERQQEEQPEVDEGNFREFLKEINPRDFSS